MPNVEWLLHEASSERALTVGQRMAVDDAHWHAVIERLEIGAGLRIFLVSAEIRDGLTVQPRDDEIEPWLSSNIALAGTVEIEMPDGHEVRVDPAQAILFRPSARNPRYRVAARQRLKLAGYALRADRLSRLFEGDIPQILDALLAPRIERSRVVRMRATRRLRQLGDALFAPGLNGPLRTLSMEGTVLQLLAAQTAAGATSQSADAPLSERERNAVEGARDLLLVDMRVPPSLGALAASVGLTEKRLNAGFRARFGATVFEVLRNERLMHARIALETGTVPLKQIAYRVGYNHVTNFINAFTARYGAPPRRFAERAPKLLPSTMLTPET